MNKVLRMLKERQLNCMITGGRKWEKLLTSFK